jgi:hypothetical protein
LPVTRRHRPLRVVSFDVREETYRRLTSQRGGLPSAVRDDDRVAVLGEREPRWLPTSSLEARRPKMRSPREDDGSTLNISGGAVMT